MSQLFASGDQRIGASPSASALPMNIQCWLPEYWLVWSCSPRDSQESSQTPHFKSINSLALNLLYSPTLTSVHDYWENHSFHYMDLCQQSDVSAFYYSVQVCQSFLQRSKCLLISWLQSTSAVILEPKKIKSVTISIFSPIYLPCSDETRCHDLRFLNVEFQTSFFTLLFHFHQEAL